MKRHLHASTIVLAAAICLPTAPTAHAAYAGLQLDHYTSVVVDGTLRDVYRVSAQFTSASDRVNAWGNGIIQNVLADGTPGSSFYNNDVWPPLSPNWDTFPAINTVFQPGGIPGTPAFIVGHTWNGVGNGFFIDPTDPQGFPGPDLRVLLMQLTVNAGEHVRGTITVNWMDAFGLPTAATNQTFNSIPAPGAAIGLLLLPMMPRRRRRG